MIMTDLMTTAHQLGLSKSSFIRLAVAEKLEDRQ